MINRRCYKLNGGYDARGNPLPIAYSNKKGYTSGFNLGLYLPPGGFIVYYLGEYFDTPIFSELNRIIEGGRLSNIYVIKTFDWKQPRPYNQCSKMSKEYRMPACLEPKRIEFFQRNCNCTVGNCKRKEPFTRFISFKGYLM